MIEALTPSVVCFVKKSIEELIRILGEASVIGVIEKSVTVETVVKIFPFHQTGLHGVRNVEADTFQNITENGSVSIGINQPLRFVPVQNAGKTSVTVITLRRYVGIAGILTRNGQTVIITRTTKKPWMISIISIILTTKKE